VVYKLLIKLDGNHFDKHHGAIISLALSGKNERRTLVGLGLSKIASLLINCATMHRILRCGLYANKKSWRWRTSGRGGVQAQGVNVDGNA